MSEFSDSYHLRADDPQAGVDLLRKAGLDGYVFPAENGWVAVVAGGEAFEPNHRLIEASAGVLLHYMNAPDNGWGFELYRDGQRLARYEAEWDHDLRVTVDEVDRTVLQDALGHGFRDLNVEDYRRIFHPAFDELMEGTIADEPPFAERFADVAGLTNVSWVSYDYVDGDYDDDPDLAAGGIVRVDAA